jgi:phage/plasmid-associated DNA primase
MKCSSIGGGVPNKHNKININRWYPPPLFDAFLHLCIYYNSARRFSNGMLDVCTGELRPFVRDDYVSITTGYDYVPFEDVEDEYRELVERFYSQVLPTQEEREFFVRVVAQALFSRRRAKHFMVLMDERDGSNGKTTLMRAVEHVFGAFHAFTERDFLYESAFANPNGASANLLAYCNKRLAFFDEPDGEKRLDLRRIKDLVSGQGRIRGRQLHSSDILDAPWESLIVIACNEASFPQVDASDRPLMRRMKALKMRSLFLDDKGLRDRHIDSYDESDLVFPAEGDDFDDRLKDARPAHLLVLIDAYRRYVADGRDFGNEPDVVNEMIGRIVEEGDPRIAKALDFIDARIDFQPVRKPEFAGKTYYAWIVEKELGNAFEMWIKEETHADFRRGLDKRLAKKTAWKKIMQTAMKMRGRESKSIKPQGADGFQGPAAISFNNVEWRAWAMD